MTAVDIARFASKDDYRAEGQALINGMFEEMCLSAELTLALPAETLQLWFQQQVGWWGQHAQKLKAVLEKNRKDGHEGLTIFSQEVRLENAVDTIRYLRQSQHVLVCPWHGVQGADMESEFPGLVPFVVYESLANRGCFDGNPTAWERRCEKCLRPLLEAAARRRYERWLNAYRDA